MPLSLPDTGEVPPKLNILVVDDDAVLRLMMSILLRKEGHRVLLADGGRSALEQLNNEEIDLVLLDLSMPDLDGFEVLNIFRARPSTRWQPVIVVSANETEALILQALEAGADDYMTKPIDRGFLMAKIRNFSRGISIQRRNLSLLASLREKQQALLDRQLMRWSSATASKPSCCWARCLPILGAFKSRRGPRPQRVSTATSWKSSRCRPTVSIWWSVT